MKHIASGFEKTVETLIFSARWVQAPMYLGLGIASVAYAYQFFLELIHLIKITPTATAEVMMLGILSLIDITMLSNLIVVVLVGGYATFVSRLDIDHHRDRPEWLNKMDAGTLKVKLVGSLIAVSGVHLLRTFVHLGNQTMEQVYVQIVIHFVFLLSGVMLAWTERLMHRQDHSR